MSRADFRLSNQGFAWLVTPLNEAARDHLAGQAHTEATWHGLSLVVEPRYLDQLLTNVQDAGFTTSE